MIWVEMFIWSAINFVFCYLELINVGFLKSCRFPLWFEALRKSLEFISQVSQSMKKENMYFKTLLPAVSVHYFVHLSIKPSISIFADSIFVDVLPIYETCAYIGKRKWNFEIKNGVGRYAVTH